ncbi:sensor histidine kinase [Mesorhizobium sp. WSM1497]|uniref:sensor histidine kinase n=1 Tax=Mesorhizobium sp. WSM1497 TaxID=278153 RepID=UPI0007EE0ED5|nr:HAMP domain-containing sensor histidine kinase [Mesorhizobium sp. WSM1497]ARP63681.1 sensor histidine kinase [Mesorhizobium sp. WSM1497]
MLDLKTVLVVTFATASLQAVTWLFVWLAWRRLYELKFLAAGFVAIAAGVLLILLRGEQPAAWAIVLHNTIIKLGLVLLAEGLARFLGQPRYTWIIRIHASTFFTVVMMSVMCLGLMRDRTQPTLLRWITIGVLAEYIAASVLQSIIEYRLPVDFQGASVLADRNAWYLLQGALFLIAFFGCLLFMVSSRLSSALLEKNIALSREVRERRRLESRLNASLAAERVLRDEQADFMRVVSHEFRTPLAIIRNAADMIGLVGHKSPEATRERIAGIGEALDRLFSLIDRFMANDRDSGFQPEMIRVGLLIADVRLHFGMTGRGERLIFTADDDAVSLVADPEMLATVLINLIDNALKYSSEDQPVDIDVRSEGRSAVIRVRDRGIGIPQAELHKIGRRFFRASNTMAGTGTGLGLYSSRKLLAYHGGKLQLLANDDQGITSIVSLPLAGEATDRLSPEELTA